MNKEEIRNAINKEVEKIEAQLQNEVRKQLHSLLKFDTNENIFLEFELEIHKRVLELGKIILEGMIPIVYGDGYKGPKVIVSDDETYSCVIRQNPRALKTIFGGIKVSRAYYQYDQTGGSLGLLDKDLDIHNYKISPALRYFAGLTGTITSFGEASSLLQRLNGIKLSSSEIDILTESKAKEIDDKFYKKVKNIPHDCDGRITPAIIDVEGKPEKTIYLECDGCYVPTKEDWRECKTLLLFETEKKEDKTIIKNKEYYSTTRGVIYFKKQVRTKIEEYCGDAKVKIICIGDGAKWIWKMMQELIPKGRVDILDWYHVAERIGLIASEFYPKDETAREELRHELKGYFYNGEYDKAIGKLNELYESTKSKELKGLIFQQVGYFDNNKDRMDYKQYRKEGYAIGSGAIESANKYVIQRRLKIPGSVWTAEHANAMAHLRAEYINGNFDKIYRIKNNPFLAVT